MDDELWALIDPLLPPWPERARLGFGSGRTCWRRLDRWQKAGVFDRLTHRRDARAGTGFDKAAQKLASTGASVQVLPFDRHPATGHRPPATGGTIRTELRSRATRQAVTRLATDVFPLPQQRRCPPLAEPDRE